MKEGFVKIHYLCFYHYKFHINDRISNSDLSGGSSLYATGIRVVVRI
jgi:hypothetical protein